MKTIKYTTGYIGKYDETFKPGDLIIAYVKGYHEFVKYEDRGDNITPLIHYKRKFNFNGKPNTSKVILKCDAFYGRRASIHLMKSIESKKKEIVNLNNILIQC